MEKSLFFVASIYPKRQITGWRRATDRVCPIHMREAFPNIIVEHGPWLWWLPTVSTSATLSIWVQNHFDLSKAANRSYLYMIRNAVVNRFRCKNRKVGYCPHLQNNESKKGKIEKAEVEIPCFCTTRMLPWFHLELLDKKQNYHQKKIKIYVP